MNDQQARTIKGILEARAPDAGVTVTPQPDGAEILISGPGMSPLSPRQADIRFSVTDDSPYLMRLLASATRNPSAPGQARNTRLGHPVQGNPA